ncbi:MAG: ABC transporter permease [Chthoniobacterales bacterium]|nr:ABC transporter permease [Chthoniobacterales bacterium]
MLTDLRYAFRMLLKAPAFSIIAIVALALGIGANTAIFSVVDAVFMRPLPYPHSEQLVLLREKMPLFDTGAVSYPNFLDWRAAQRSLTDLALFRRESMNLSSRGEETPPERIAGAVMSWNLLRITGLKPLLGRDFTEAEDVPHGPKIALINEALWKKRFDGSPKVIGQQLLVDAVPREIVGVLPNEMQMMRAAQVYLPLGDLRSEHDVLQRDSHPGFSAFGRLKPGVTLKQARADLDNIAHELTRRYPASNTGRTINAIELLESVIGDYRQNLHLLLVAVGCVLLIACANVTNLQLARALARGKELAVRAAMGASRWRLMRLMLIESAILGVVGGLAGLLIALWSLDAIHALSPPNVSRFQETRLDFLTLGFATATALLCGILVGIWPAWRISRLVSLSGVLHEAGSRGGSDSGDRQRARGILVVTQVALALVLLAGAGLTIRSFWNSENARLGFEPHGILTMTLALPEARYDSNEKIANFNAQLIERVNALPGAAMAAIGSNVPFDNTEWDSSFHLTGSPPNKPGQEPSAEVNVISPDYFKVLKMPLLRGRGFGREERLKQPRSVVIDDVLANRYFPGRDPIGQHIDDNQTNDENPPPLTIVGVVPHVRPDVPGGKFDRLNLPQMYFSAAQLTTHDENNLLVRVASGDPGALAPAVVRAVQSIDPDQPVASIAAMEKNISESLATRRLTMTLLGAFAALALVLASVGLYGVMALSVTQRTREFGIRLALGAPRRDVFRLALGRGLLLVGIGLALGLLGALGAGRALTSLLYNVGSLDPAALCTAIFALAAVALLACWFPARRATRVDPIVALRYE